MSLVGAVDRLGTWAITGVTNYGLDDTPSGAIPTDALPALVVDPAWGQGGSFQPFDLGGAAGRATVFLDHLLLYTTVGLGRPQVRFYGVVAVMDLYFAKVADEWTLNDNLLEPLTIGATIFGNIPFGGIIYYGVRVRHKWVLRLT